MEHVKFGLGLFGVACSIPMLARIIKVNDFSWFAMGLWGSIFAVSGALIKLGL